MSYYYKWRPSKTRAREFAAKMNEISDFCREHNIRQSSSGDSYYFNVRGVDYRVSNHTVEASNARAFDEWTGEQVRELYHPDGRDDGRVHIFAGKTRIVDIYNDLAAGYELDARGYKKV